MQKTKNWIRIIKKIIGTEKTSEIDFSSRSHIFTKKEPLDNSFKEVEYKDQNIIYFIILDGLLR